MLHGAKYLGHSMVVDPRGEVIGGCGEDECVITASIDVAEVQRTRGDFPALTDRQPWLNI